MKKPLILFILDGWGHSTNTQFNAIFTAKTPTFDFLSTNYLQTFLKASGLAVGLPDGQMGNSEVGHMTIGLGRVLMQNLVKINLAIENDKKNYSTNHSTAINDQLNEINNPHLTSKKTPNYTIKNNPELIKIINNLKVTKKTFHLWGLCSDGGIHSHINHMIAIIHILIEHKIQFAIHICTDGRDTSPQSCLQYIQQLYEIFGNDLHIATIAGRFYAMDRDNRWERIQTAYDCIVQPTKFIDNNIIDNNIKAIQQYINKCYNEQIFDEFIPPIALLPYSGIQDGDAFFIFNYRSDRVKQLLTTFTNENFSHFKLNHKKFSSIASIVEYGDEFNDKVQVCFKRDITTNSLGQVLEMAQLKQCRIAETEKYAHVTFFLNGGIEHEFKNETRILVDSPKVETYDQTPEMSCEKITDELLTQLNKNEHDFYVVNFANPDMIGHTGNFEQTVNAIEKIDQCLEKIYQAILNGLLIITADHGNAEEMFNFDTNQPHTAHTINDVPFIIVNKAQQEQKKLKTGGLQDIAPTILKLMNIQKPSEMTGESLI